MKIASKKTPLWARIAAILTVSCMLCFLAVYNGFPLVFNNDTGMYLENAYDWYVSVDRPATYGQFLFFRELVVFLVADRMAASMDDRLADVLLVLLLVGGKEVAS